MQDLNYVLFIWLLIDIVINIKCSKIIIRKVPFLILCYFFPILYKSTGTIACTRMGPLVLFGTPLNTVIFFYCNTGTETNIESRNFNSLLQSTLQTSNKWPYGPFGTVPARSSMFIGTSISLNAEPPAGIVAKGPQGPWYHTVTVTPIKQVSKRPLGDGVPSGISVHW